MQGRWQMLAIVPFFISISHRFFEGNRHLSSLTWNATSMLFPVALLVPILASLIVYRWFQKQSGGTNYWAKAAAISGIVAAIRISFVSLGAYVLGNTSSWLQLPAYVMALCALPEAILMGRPVDRSWWGLAGLLLAGSAAWIFAIAALAARAKTRSHSSR
jgi:hypothetical protein